jgi:hypothetical protein
MANVGIMICGEDRDMEKRRKREKQGMRQRVMITLPSDLWKNFRIRAIEVGVPASHLLETVVKSYLAGEERGHLPKRPEKQKETKEPLF